MTLVFKALVGQIVVKSGEGDCSSSGLTVLVNSRPLVKVRSLVSNDRTQRRFVGSETERRGYVGAPVRRAWYCRNHCSSKSTAEANQARHVFLGAMDEAPSRSPFRAAPSWLWCRLFLYSQGCSRLASSPCRCPGLCYCCPLGTKEDGTGLRWQFSNRPASQTSIYPSPRSCIPIRKIAFALD